MAHKNTTHLHVSLHLSEEVDVDVTVNDGKLSLHLITVSLSDPRMSSYFDLHGDTEQMERVVAAMEQGLDEVLRQRVSDYDTELKDAGRGDLLR